jgi:Holliday junction resolvasome RuvABC endonuclease subunit
VRFILSVDPGVVTGWAWVQADRPIRVLAAGQQRDLLGDGIARIVHAFAATAYGQGATELVLAIESQYIPRLGGDARANRGKSISVLKVAAFRGRWLGMAESYGLEVEQMNPSTWRAAQLGATNLKQSQFKKLAITKARSYYPDVRGDHAAEAILIGAYVATQKQQETLWQGLA